jgi:hypothetical protein
MEETFTLPERSIRALDETDQMPAALRECVHEFGYAIVHACVQRGVVEPRHIRSLVREIWDGARQPAQRNRIGRKYSPVLDSLDWILIQAGAGISATTLVRVLWDKGMVIVPNEPGHVMIEASLATVTGGNVICTKPEKHRRRLRAALRAQAQRLWPQLFSQTQNWP